MTVGNDGKQVGSVGNAGRNGYDGMTKISMEISADKKYNTHAFIIMNALKILIADGYSSVCDFIMKWNLDLDELVNLPDRIESESSSGTHYYIVRGSKSREGGYYKNRNGNYSRSARSKLEDHYFTALTLYKNGYIESAIKSLCYSVHYLSDAICSPHAGGVSDVNHPFRRPHRKYERYVQIHNYRFAANTAKEYYGIWRMGFEKLNEFSTHSASFKSDIKNLVVANYDAVTAATLPLAQQLVAALIHQFYQDVGSISDTANLEAYKSVLGDSKAYYIKNYGSGKYLEAASNSLVKSELSLKAFSGKENQKFIAKLSKEGYFCLIQQEKAISFKGSRAIMASVNGCIEQRFKLTYVGGGKYRIMTGNVSDNDFADVLGGRAKDASVAKYNFQPDNLYQYWQIEEV